MLYLGIARRVVGGIYGGGREAYHIGVVFGGNLFLREPGWEGYRETTIIQLL
jgi:hypothetical protein